MAQFKTHKFVAALPPELEADAIYFVRSGSGFDLYVTNHSGTIVAYPANSGVDLSNYAPKNNPTFTGTTSVPTVVTTDDSTKIASTEFVNNFFYDVVAPQLYETFATHVLLAGKASITSPDFLGNPTAPTKLVTDNSRSLATTEFVQSIIMKGLSAYCSGKPAASEKVGGGTAPYTFTISTANSKAVADVAATATTVFNILKGGSNIGTITFSAGGTVGVFNISTPSITKGDKLRITAPATPDATLADIDFLLVA